MLEVKRLAVSIGPTPILRDVSLTVEAGSMCGLIGRNGAGKTTFMRAVMGVLKPDEGSIRIDELDLLSQPAHRRTRAGVGYMPEDRRLVPELSAEENVMLPVWSTGIADADKRLSWIYDLMPEVQEFRDRGATTLSGGQQKFVAFARALMAGTQLLLLDEPTEGIAPVFAHRMTEIVSDLRASGISVLVAESNTVHFQGVLDHTFHIERGSIIEADG
jgi:branched-chain amino acid transport system ATP-binding protein